MACHLKAATGWQPIESSDAFSGNKNGTLGPKYDLNLFGGDITQDCSVPNVSKHLKIVSVENAGRFDIAQTGKTGPVRSAAVRRV